ncbi:putative MFS-type transporter [Fusarium oxysporum f. sp. rapae]|uniref:Putative MFS-type transporter n=1 Tax=Fusarium oxysporum f. sp. rapae TaxID=485398 RepID=A0A8J5PGT9_FUSOX|nr:putative MFS-type transporter [Fusarium oxysporum f. sp. rapae]
MILLWNILFLALPIFISCSTAFPHNIEADYPDLYSFRHRPYDHIGRIRGEGAETDVSSLETEVLDHSTEHAVSETPSRSTPTQEVQYSVVGSPVASTTSEVLSEVTLSGSAHLSQDHFLSFSSSTSERADDSTGFASTLVDSSHPSSQPTTIPLALPTESPYSTETVEFSAAPISHPSPPTQISRDSPSVRTSDTSISTPGGSQELGQTHSGSTLEVVSTFETLPTISPFPGDTSTSPLTGGDTTATPNGSTRDFSTALDTTESGAQASQEGTSKKLPAETSNALTTESQWDFETGTSNLGSTATGTSDLTGTVALSATTAATLATDTIVSSEQTSTNDETTPLGGATTASIVTSPVTSPAPSTDLIGDVDSSVVSTDVLTPTETVPKGSFTSMDSSTPGIPTIDTQTPGSTGEPSTAPLTEPETPESKSSTAVISPSDDTSATLGRSDERTTEELPPTSSYQASKSETNPTATHKQSTSHAKASNVVVTASSDAIVTFAPTKDPEFTSLTETTTTTDYNGIIVVIWPRGWKWKPVGDKMPATLPNPPKSNPSPVADPGDEDSDDDDVSTKEAKSTVTTTAPASTTATSAEPTSEATTSEATAECAVTEIPECTKTISYITMSQSVTIREIGECPPTPSCATDPQQGPSEAELNAPVDQETEEYLEDFFREHDLLLDYEAEDALPECSTVFSGLDLTCFSGTWPSFCTRVVNGDNETLVENITAKALEANDKTKRDGTEDAYATPTVDPNYQPLVQQDPECLEATDGDHSAIDPGTQDDYAEDFSSQEPDGGWEAGPDIQHSYKETSHGVVYEYKVDWAQDCITDGDTQDVRWPLGQAGDVTAYSLMRGAFEKCNNGGIGGSIQAGPLNFPKGGLALYMMTVTEVGCMGVKPNMNIMDHTTPEGKILTDAWNTVIIKPGGPQRVYWGLESVEPSKVWCFFDFDSVEQHQQFAEEYGADAVKDIPKICTYGEFSKHIKMVPSSDVLESPLTEIVLAYFPQDISEERKETLSSKIQEILRQPFPDEARVAHAWGVENDFPARSENGLPRSLLIGFVGLSHSEAWGDYHQTDGWKEALSSIEGLEGSLKYYRLIVYVSEYFVSGFNIILPSLADISDETRTWPAAVINLTTAVLILPFARLSEIHGGRFIFLGGHAWLIVWSIIAGFSQNPTMLIACRAMQGLGLSAFMPSGVVIMSRIYRPGPRNTLVFSMFGAFSCICFYSGIFLGALSAQVLGYKWYFFIVAFFCASIFIIGLLTIPKSRGDPRPDLKMDWLGTAAVVPGLALVVYALTGGRNAPQGWRTPFVNVALILGIICLALFVYIEGWRASQPLIPAEVLKTKYMSRLVVALFISYGSFGLVLFYASFYIESVLYVGPLLTAAWFIPLAVGGFILAVVGGFVLHILSGRLLLIISCLGFLGSTILFALIPESGRSNTFLYWAFVFPAMILATVGVDIAFNITNFLITTSLPGHLQAVAGALITSLLYLGMAFWVGVGEVAISAQKEIKGAENLDAPSQCQIEFWTGTGLALIFITVKMESSKADLTAGEKAQRGRERDVRQNTE